MIIVQRGTGNAQTIRREYLLTDAQGSTYAVLDDYGMPINASARMSFDPFGKRRAAADWTTATPWSTTLGNELKDTTRRGYAGHEQVDAVGIIHMGGRIYDPNLGRFLQADPFIQAPGNSQSLNRYTYVFNNPMAWTDPTGYWGAREQAGLRTVAAIVIACFTGYYAGVAMSAGGATAASNAAMISFAGGFAAGAVQSGNLRGAVIGGISSLAFFGVAKAFPVKGMNLGTGEGMAAYSKLALASGVTGGIMAEVQGGRFGNGFISAGASAFLSPIPEAATSNPAGQMVVTAVIGGTVSRIGGGKFANGAITASFQFAMGKAVASSVNQKESPIEEEGSGFAGKPYYVRDYSAPIVNVTFVGVRDSEFLSSMLFSASADYYASVGIRVQFNEVSPGTKNSLTIQLGNGTPMTETYALASFATISTGIFGAQRSVGVFLN